MTDFVDSQRSRTSKVVLGVLAVPVGAVLAWLALLGALNLPSDRPGVWLGVPLLVVAAVGWLVSKRAPWLGVPLAVAGVATLAFFVWLFGQFGQGMQDF